MDCRGHLIHRSETVGPYNAPDALGKNLQPYNGGSKVSPYANPVAPTKKYGRSKVSPAGSVTSSSDSHLDCHSLLSVSLRYPPLQRREQAPALRKSRRSDQKIREEQAPPTGATFFAALHMEGKLPLSAYVLCA